jgi:hypothetical protein
VEEHYQLRIKDRGVLGKDHWSAGKGKPPRDTSIDLWGEYKKLWRTWAEANPDLMQELATVAKEYHDYTLSDMFASTDISQARALAELLNELN